MPITLNVTSYCKRDCAGVIKDWGMIFWIILVGLKCNHKSPHHKSPYKREAERGLTTEAEMIVLQPGAKMGGWLQFLTALGFQETNHFFSHAASEGAQPGLSRDSGTDLGLPPWRTVKSPLANLRT